MDNQFVSLSMEDILELGFIPALMTYPLEIVLDAYNPKYEYLGTDPSWCMQRDLKFNSIATLETTKLTDIVLAQAALKQGYKIVISAKIFKIPENIDSFYQRAISLLKDHTNGNLSVENGVILNTTIPQQQKAIEFLKELNIAYQVKLSGKETVNPLLKKEFKPSKLIDYRVFYPKNKDKEINIIFDTINLKNAIKNIYIGNKQLNWEWLGKQLFEKNALKLHDYSDEFKEELINVWNNGSINLDKLIYNPPKPISSHLTNSVNMQLTIALEITLYALKYYNISFSKEDIIKTTNKSQNKDLNYILYQHYLSQSNGLDWLNCGDESFIYNVCDYLLSDEILLKNYKEDIYNEYQSAISFLNLNKNIIHTSVLVTILKNSFKPIEALSITENTNLNLTM